MSHDPVKHPSHYVSAVPGIECIQVAQHFNFNLGNAIKYIWRAGKKGAAKQDLEKAKQYIEFELARLAAADGKTDLVAGASIRIPHEGAYEDNWQERKGPKSGAV